MKYMSEDGEILDTINPELTIYFKTPFNHDTTKEAELTATRDFEPTKTDQSFKEDADINVITKRLRLGMQYEAPLPEHFGVDERINLYEARMRIAESNATFYNLAPEIRSEFLNDPARWEQQVQRDMDSGNIENLERMGLKFTIRPPEASPGGISSPGAPGDKGAVSAAPEAPKKTDSGK